MFNDIKIVKNRTEFIQIYLEDASENPYDLQEDESVVFGVKENPNDQFYVIYKKLHREDGENGVYNIEITPEDTEWMNNDVYVYDIVLFSNEQRVYTVVPISKLYLIKNVVDGGESYAR